MKTLLFSVFISLVFCAGVFGVPANQGTQNAAVNIGAPVIDMLPEIAAEQSIAVSGTAHSKSYILLYVNGACVSETQATSSAGGLEGEGAFAFENVALAEGENEIYVVSCLGRNKNGFEIYSEPIIVYYEPYGKKIIGSEGGTLVSRDLALELIVPAGALQSKTLISVERLDVPLGEIEYELQPTGLVFSEPASIILHLTEEEMGWFGPKVIKVYLEGEDGSKEELPCLVDEETGIISAEVGHFSRLTITAPLQFMDVQFKEEEKTWTEDGYIKTRKRKWFQNWDYGAGVGWWLSSSNLFKGIKLVAEITSYYENFSGSIRNIPLNSWEITLLKPTSISQWGRNAFQECDIFDIWHWTEYFQCGSRGADFDFGGVGSFYWYERWEYSSSHNLCWEIESKTKGRLELLATTSASGASAEVIAIDTLEFGE